MRAVDHDRIPKRPLVGNLDVTSLSRPRQIRADTWRLTPQFFSDLDRGLVVLAALALGLQDHGFAVVMLDAEVVIEVAEALQKML